ncbi:MAG: hypothetical protein ABFC94_02795 [Syntrophomonas sp.]
MNHSYISEYRTKFTFANEAVKHIRTGNRVRYAFGICQSNELDIALARRKEELMNISILYDSVIFPFEVMKSDPNQKHFHYEVCKWDGYSNYELSFTGLVNKSHHTRAAGLVFMASVSTMDSEGFFWYAKEVPENAFQAEIINADYVMVEVNENISEKRKSGGRIHISQVDLVVPSNNAPLLNSLNRKLSTAS